jgi:D-serine deaminase-like pyridoxal phosphate-dependent protein
MGLDVDRVTQIALDVLADQRIDWRFKGFPARFDGLTVRDVIAARPPLSEMATPLMYLDGDALAHNIATMAGFCRDHGVDLAPHAKTTMAPQLIVRQLDAGAWGVTAATIGHTRTYRAFGVATVILANQLIDPDALAWVAAELRRDPGFRLLCFADSVAGVDLMQAALVAAGSTRPVDVIIDLGRPGGRTGCRTLDQAETVARAVRAASTLRLVGAGGFEGALAGDRSADGLAIIRAYLGDLVALIERLDAAGLFDETAEIIATAGGSAYFDDVASSLRGIAGTSRPVRVVLRSGAYVTHDDAHYRVLTPLRDGGFHAALRVRGRVLSQPEPGLALLDFGKRDAPADLGMPIPLWLTRGDGDPEPLPGAGIKALADQHAFLTFDETFEESVAPAVGDIVTCGISHPCTAFDKWQLIPVIEDGRVTDIVRTFF